MDREEFISLLDKCDIYQLRRIARVYEITPSTKSSAELIEEIKACVTGNKKQTRSTRGRKPKSVQLEDVAVLLKNCKKTPISEVEKLIDEFIDKQIKDLYKLKKGILDILK